MLFDIASSKNEKVKRWRSLKKGRADRLAHGLFLAEGEHMTREAIKENHAIALLMDADAIDKYRDLLELSRDIDVYRLASHLMAAICDAKTPQGVAAVCPYPGNATLSDLGTRVVALDDVQDPGNVGAILRTMDAAAFTGLLLSDACADPFGAKALRATMGGVFRVPVRVSDALTDDLLSLKSQGFELIAGDLRGEPIDCRAPFGGQTCLMIGNEGAGLSPQTLALADRRVRLPMPGGAESLNAAVAAGILIYDILRDAR